MILSDLERWDAKGQNFPENLDNYAPHKERPITVLIFVARGLFLGGNARQFLFRVRIRRVIISVRVVVWFKVWFWVFRFFSQSALLRTTSCAQH